VHLELTLKPKTRDIGVSVQPLRARSLRGWESGFGSTAIEMDRLRGNAGIWLDRARPRQGSEDDFHAAFGGLALSPN